MLRNPVFSAEEKVDAAINLYKKYPDFFLLPFYFSSFDEFKINVLDQDVRLKALSEEFDSLFTQVIYQNFVKKHNAASSYQPHKNELLTESIKQLKSQYLMALCGVESQLGLQQIPLVIANERSLRDFFKKHVMFSDFIIEHGEELSSLGEKWHVTALQQKEKHLQAVIKENENYVATAMQALSTTLSSQISQSDSPHQKICIEFVLNECAKLNKTMSLQLYQHYVDGIINANQKVITENIEFKETVKIAALQLLEVELIKRNVDTTQFKSHLSAQFYKALNKRLARVTEPLYSINYQNNIKLEICQCVKEYIVAYVSLKAAPRASASPFTLHNNKQLPMVEVKAQPFYTEFLEGIALTTDEQSMVDKRIHHSNLGIDSVLATLVKIHTSLGEAKQEQSQAIVGSLIKYIVLACKHDDYSKSLKQITDVFEESLVSTTKSWPSALVNLIKSDLSVMKDKLNDAERLNIDFVIKK